jgi:hypothetical protein
MKFILTLLTIASIAWFVSCTKKIDVLHDIHDTLYLQQVRVDTFHSVFTRIDTIVLHDNHKDTVVQIKHDTLILTKTTTDTLFKNLFDTVYLTKTLHDTITKTVYIHDTLNNCFTIIIHDTVIRIVTVVQIDTVTNYVRSNWLNYPVPAPDSVKQFFVHFDTIPGLTITSIEFQNIYSWDLSAGSFGFFSQDITYNAPIFTQVAFNGPAPVHDWQIYLPGPMVCNIIITYNWLDGVTFPIFQLETFPSNPGPITRWETTAPGGISQGPGSIHIGQTSRFDYINLPSVFEMNIRNH